MIYVQVKSDRDPRVLADLIKQSHGNEAAAGKHADEATLVREVRKEIEATRTPRQDLETVNFQRLDSENDWTDL